MSATSDEGLDLVELLGDLGAFLFDGVGGVFDEGIDGDDFEVGVMSSTEHDEEHPKCLKPRKAWGRRGLSGHTSGR